MDNVFGFMEKFGIHKLSVEQRLALIEEIWKSIDAETAAVDLLFDARCAEFECPLCDQDPEEEDFYDLYEVGDLFAYSRSRN